ncbi:MAG: DUF2927 domain-containing protein [Devosia sp.]
MHKSLIVGLTALAMAAFAPLASVAVASGSPDANGLSRAFYRTVFGLEYGANQTDAQRVKRFSGPVAFHITDLSGAKRQATAERFIKSLPSRIRYLRARLVQAPSAANFRVILVKDRDFRAVVARELKADAVAMNARCLVGVTTRNGRIRHSVAIIVADDDYLFARCLVEEVLQGLGPMNDDDRLVHSVFNDTSRHTHFTAFDEALMNLLYHPMIRPGMTDSEVQETLPKVMRQLGYLR